MVYLLFPVSYRDMFESLLFFFFKFANMWDMSDSLSENFARYSFIHFNLFTRLVSHFIINVYSIQNDKHFIEVELFNP